MDTQKVSKSHVPVATVTAQLIVPTRQPVSMVIHESKVCKKRCRLIAAKGTILKMGKFEK